MRLGSRALMAVYQATIPWVSIIIRRCYGVAGGGHGRDGLNLRYAWPSADWGSLPIEGGVQAAYRRDIEAADDPKARRRELEICSRNLGPLCEQLKLLELRRSLIPAILDQFYAIG